jgi:glyoxylase-like metal-dependent hydrolase (beta-lactamase superfamily II)
MLMTTVKTLNDLLTKGEASPAASWQVRALQSDQCFSYVAWNETTREALVVDPKDEDHDAYRAIARELAGYRWLAVLDSHTHADHVSVAAELATELKAPLVMHELAPSKRVDLRVSHSTKLPGQAAPVEIYVTPGHTPDSITIAWGPFVFGGDTLLYGDVGRDDLPGGDPEAHYRSIELLKRSLRPEQIVLPGHDHREGRASSWRDQLAVNSSLTQSHEDFVREAAAFDAPAPALLKKSLRENFK